jgi:starch synthase
MAPAASRRAKARKPPIRVAMISPEIAPFARTGGLGEVVGALARTLHELGVELALVLPAYRSALAAGSLEEGEIGLEVSLGGERQSASALRARLDGAIPVYLIRADRYFDRDQLYGTAEGDYPDNAERFVFFCRAALELLQRDPPQLLHCHDWQSALACAFLKAEPERYPALAGAKTVLTVHNLGYQGLFDAAAWPLLELDRSFFSMRFFEFYGRINFLKAGLVFADHITTVSPTYAAEIQTPEHGCGLDGVLRERSASLTGILNGIDERAWNPATDPHLPANYDARRLAGKKTCKAALQNELGLEPDPAVALFGLVARLVAQKGFDLLDEAFDELLEKPLQLVLLGAGDRRYETRFRERVARYPGRAAFRVGFDDPLAHRIEAGADLFLMPSRYEPCGLNQMFSMKYGTIPLAHATGGLKDTVEECDAAARRGNGFLFAPYTPEAFLSCVERALGVFRRRRDWTALMRRAMAADHSWKRRARAYEDLYLSLLAS